MWSVRKRGRAFSRRVESGGNGYHGCMSAGLSAGRVAEDDGRDPLSLPMKGWRRRARCSSSMRNLMQQFSPRYIPNHTLCGRTRREFLWQVGGGFAGLALIDLLSRDGFFAKRAGANDENSPATD